MFAHLPRFLLPQTLRGRFKFRDSAARRRQDPPPARRRRPPVCEDRSGAPMNNTTRPLPPLCVIRREVAEHFAAVDRAARDFRVSRAGFRSGDQLLSLRIKDAVRQLQSAVSAALEPSCIAAESIARVTDERPARNHADRCATDVRPRRTMKRSADKPVPPSASPRRPRLRLYSPTSPV